ncbi:MAG: hypothetical protein H7647_11335 [Candidatus Heimdallarchaeota archaeon]|nr:hypothetical protein [Candidatus Heimdallarchaeota archaeon]MCK4255020.1 hypothetical protein [Candidatus Heimdallarchaeota archaeon]
MVLFEGFNKSYKKLRRVRRITYIAIIVTMLSIGTWLILDGRLQARISSVAFPAEVLSDYGYDKTHIRFGLTVEIWNPSVLTRYERTANYQFTYYPCIDVTFTNLSGYNSHVVVDGYFEQSDDEYIYLMGQETLPAVGTEVLKPGINLDTAYYSMLFNEPNLTRLPLGEYRMWLKFDLTFVQDVFTNAVTMQVFENETFVTYDTISEGWGRVSLFKSCLIYYMTTGIMVIIPLVNKYEKRRKKQIIY